MTRDHRLQETERLLDALTNARLDAKLTQAELAERLHRPQSYVSKYESGERRRLDILELRAICKALGLSLTTFVRRFERSL